MGESGGGGSSEEASTRGLFGWGRVLIKAVSTNSLLSPMASKICAPWYAESSEMPISGRISSLPTSSALRTCDAAGARSVAIESRVKIRVQVPVRL